MQITTSERVVGASRPGRRAITVDAGGGSEKRERQTRAAPVLVDGRDPRLGCYLAVCLPYRFWNLATRPPVSMIFCLPV